MRMTRKEGEKMTELEKDMTEMETENQEIPEESSDETKASGELKEANDKYMRLAAEFQNYKRRTENEKHEIAAYANERLAKDLLNVIDSFERALETGKGSDAGFQEGIELIYKQLLDVLNNFGLQAIKTDHEAFDPNYHHAVLMSEEEGHESGVIIEEMQKGYTLHGKVIRPSMVRVAK